MNYIEELEDEIEDLKRSRKGKDPEQLMRAVIEYFEWEECADSFSPKVFRAVKDRLRDTIDEEIRNLK
jgi:hypothetical protein